QASRVEAENNLFRIVNSGGPAAQKTHTQAALYSQTSAEKREALASRAARNIEAKHPVAANTATNVLGPRVENLRTSPGVLWPSRSWYTSWLCFDGCLFEVTKYLANGIEKRRTVTRAKRASACKRAGRGWPAISAGVGRMGVSPLNIRRGSFFLGGILCLGAS
ncbi:hypothetical protein IMZ48_45660, partial [Candidatus Bathyarchaeota archaeon]|nr:hypothetical protein [Candidatus Bathyarchaeota archaeon]